MDLIEQFESDAWNKSVLNADRTLSRVGLRYGQCVFRLRRPRRLTRLKVFGLFSNNVGSFSLNLVLSGSSFSANVVRKWAMFLGQAIYVLGPLQIGWSRIFGI